MIKTLTHSGVRVPEFQSKGFAAKFAIPFAQQVCKGTGYDIGCNRPEWSFIDVDGVKSIPIDPIFSTAYDAYNLPDVKVDYIFSSHCLEHLPDWVQALDYWQTKLHRGGVLFLYLPSYESTYWRPWHNRKHIHTFFPQMIKDYLTDRGWENIFVSGIDLNNSFMAIANKAA